MYYSHDPSVPTHLSDVMNRCPFDFMTTQLDPVQEYEMKFRLMVFFNDVENAIQREMKRSNQSNLSCVEWSALRLMQQDDKIYLPSDKGGEFTCMSTNDYAELG